MEDRAYKHFLGQLEGLDETQAAEVAHKLLERQTGDDFQRLVSDRLAEQGGCPHCAHGQIVKFGKAHGTQRFRCKACAKTFTALTGTPFHRLRGKDKLLLNAACMADGLSIRKTAKRLGFSVDKTFRWRHKFLDFLNVQKPGAMTGVVEADETLFVRSYKGQRKALPRKAKKRGGPLKGGKRKDTVPVVVALQRGTRKVFDQVLPDAKANSLTGALRPALGEDAVLSTDGNAAYWTVAEQLKIDSGSFVSSYHGKGGCGVWHVQGVNRYDATLKNWMTRFNGVATKYLANYLGWRRLLDRFQDNVTPHQFLFHALRKTYYEPDFNT